MNRARHQYRTPLALALTAVSLMISSCPDQEKVSQPGPARLLIITLDTVRADHLSCYGYYRPTTPFLERFVKRSVMFKRVETASTITLASHASLMSSYYPRAHGAEDNGWKVKNNAPLMAEILKSRGYQTAAVIGAYPLHRYTRMNRGFDFYNDDYDNQKFHNPRKKHRLIQWYRPGQEVIDQGIRFIEQFDNTRPWFLWLHLWDAHAPYYTRREFRGFFKTDPGIEATVRERGLMKQGPTRINRYDSAIRQLDHDLMRLFQWMEQKGYMDNCIVVIGSDHGEELGEHERLGHGFRVYEAESWVPLIVRFPNDQFMGQVVEEWATNLDLAPTLYDFLGIVEPRNMAGVSLMPAIRGQGKVPERPIFIRRRWLEPFNDKESGQLKQHDTIGLVSGQYKYIWNSKSPDELYNLEADPHELDDLVDRSPKLVSSLQAIVDQHQQEVGQGPWEKPPLPKKVEQGLRALGYID